MEALVERLRLVYIKGAEELSIRVWANVGKVK